MKNKIHSIIENPALEINSFHSFAIDVIREINGARVNPKGYRNKLLNIKFNQKEEIKKNILVIKNFPFQYKSLESSIDSALSFLKNQKPLPPLKYNINISQAAEKLLNFLILHDGINMDNISNPFYRFQRRMKVCGEPFGEMFELIDYGMYDPEYVVINFILSEGDLEKFDRSVIYNSKISSVGIASGLLPSDRVCTVIDFVELFYDPGDLVSNAVRKQFVDKDSVPYSTMSQNLMVKDRKKKGKKGKKFEKEKEKEEEKEKEKPKNLKIKRKESGDMFKEKRESFMDINKKEKGYMRDKDITTIKEEEVKEEEEKKEEEKEEAKKEEGKEEEKEEDYFNEDNIPPQGAKGVKITDKIIEESNGEKVRLIEKIILFEDGTKNLYLFKKPLKAK